MGRTDGKVNGGLDGVTRGRIDRRAFLGFAALGLPAVGLNGMNTEILAFTPEVDSGAGRHEPLAFPRNDPERVSAIVGASHGNIDRVRQLLGEQPALARAAWDWGFGDWETALGAASHTGRREIAELLIENGARPNLFSAAMMGELETVQAFLSRDPDLYWLPGPHGISLMNHARAGRDGAAAVVEYLLDTFGPDERPFGVPGSEALQARYAGRFESVEDPRFGLTVAVVNDWLMVGAGEQPNARVVEAGPDRFHPTSAPAVLLEFTVAQERAVSLRLRDGPLELILSRV